MSFDVFVSYSTKDAIAAKAACAALETAKIRCWMAPRDILPSASWGASIVRAINQCRVMVLIFSGNANESKQVHREVDQAFGKGKAVLPLRIEDVRPADELAFFLDTVHWLDALTPPLERNLEKLVATVHALLPTTEPSPPGAEPTTGGPVLDDVQAAQAQEDARAADEQRLKEAEAAQRAEAEQREKDAAQAQRQKDEADAQRLVEERRKKEEEDKRRADELEAKRRTEQERAFAAAKRADSVAAVDEFLAACPASHLITEARTLRATLAERDEAYKAAVARADPALLKAFLERYPAGEAADQVRKRLRRVERPKTRPWRRAAIIGGGAAGVAILAALAVWLGLMPTPTPNIVSALSPEQEQALKPKDTFKECTKCPNMVVVPAGSFTMGSRASEPGHSENEGPQHKVTIAGQFAVGQFELTFDEWDACVADGGCGYKPSDEGWGRGRRPVINVSWDDASAYVAWLSKKTGKPYRLLSEAEYEYATRAGTTTAYPWGDAIGTNNANCDGCGSQWDGKETAPVGSFPPNKFGLYDMVGNVWEWTEDCYQESYHGAPTDGSAWTRGGDCSYRVVRGGSWYDSPGFLRSAGRGRFTTGPRNFYLGFRVGRTLLTP